MSIPELPACAALGDYMSEDGHLLKKIRMGFGWDEREFHRLVQVSARCLEEIGHDAMIPRFVARFFGEWLHTIMGVIRHPDFPELNCKGRTEREAEAYFCERYTIMQKLVRWMANGPRPYPAADFLLPGWPPLTEAPDITLPTLGPRAAPACAPARPACDALFDYMHGDGRRFERPGASLKWDDDAFRTLVQLTTQCLDEIEHDDMIPRHVGKLIGDWLQDLEQTLRDPQFLAHNRGERAEQENKIYFKERISKIIHLVSWMFAGKPERPACDALREYMREDDDLFDKIRMGFEWDEGEFHRLVQVSTRCLEEIEQDTMIPRYVASFFGYWLYLVMGTIRHPDFLKLNRQGRTEQDNEAYFRDRTAIMKKLSRWMSHGRRPYPAADYVLPGWPPITEAPDVTAPTRIRREAPAYAQERPACAALHDHMVGDGRRFERPSPSLPWDDDAFRTLVQLSTQCLEQIQHDDMIPRYAAELIGDWLQDLKQTLRDPRFLALHRGDRTEHENKGYFDARITIIDRLVSWMSDGQCPYLPVHFVAPEWQTSGEREEAKRIKEQWSRRDRSKRR